MEKKPPRDSQKGIAKLELPPRADALIQKLLANRVIFIGLPIDDTLANLVIGQMRQLRQCDSRASITLAVNSPGGYVSSALAILDAMTRNETPVHTICLGQAHGTAGVLVASGAKGHRQCVTKALFQLCPVEAGMRADPKTREEVDPLHDRIAEVMARATGQPAERVRADMALSTLLDAESARRYGFVDAVTDALELPLPR